MANSAAAEQLPQELPQEEAPKKGPELKLVPPLPAESAEISEPVKDSLSEKAKETAATLKPESRGFLGKIYEKIKSSEFVQNIVDRYQVWRNEGLAERAKNKMGKLGGEKDGEETKARGAEASAGKTEADLAKLQETFKAMGKELDPKVLAKTQEEIAGHKKRAEEAGASAQMIEGRIQDVKTNQENYENKVGEARGRLDGRLEAKQEINNKALAEHGERRNQINESLGNNQKQIEKLDGHAKELRGLLESGVTKSLKKTIETSLKEIDKKKADLAEVNGKLEKAKATEEEKIKDLEGRNKNLQEKRDKIFPLKEKPAEAAKPAEEATWQEIGASGEMILEYGGGKKLVLTEKGMIQENPDGSSSETSLDDISDDQLEQFMVMSTDGLADSGVSPKIVERMKKAAEKKEGGEKKIEFTAGDIVGGWNAGMKGKMERGLQVALEKGSDPGRDLGSKDGAREFLLDLLAKKVAGGDKKRLSPAIAHKVDTFFAERK